METIKEEKKAELEMTILEKFRLWIKKLREYLKERAFLDDWWTWLENVEFCSQNDLIDICSYNSDFLDWLVENHKIDLDKTDDYYWEEWFKPINFGKYLDDRFWQNYYCRILFLIDVLL